MAIQRDKIIASAEKLVAKGKVEAAIKEYERLLDDNPNDVNTLNRIGDLWVRITRNDEAVKVFSKIADHYSKDGFFLKAIAIYKKINKLDPSKLDIYAKLADLYAKQGLAMEAKSQYQVLADYYLKHGDPGNALGAYKKISELDPNSINVHVKLADLYSQNGQTAEALKEYDRVGRMLLKRGMLDEAVQVFRKALKIDATNLELIESLVTALHDAKDFDNAIQILDTSLEKNRENPRLLSMLAKSHLGKGDVKQARSVLERGLKSNPADANLRETLLDVYLKQNDVDRAVELAHPLVDSALDRGDGRAAVDLLQRILKSDGANVSALTKLVAVFTKLREETNILTAMNSLAEAHIAHRNYADAAQTLSELTRREPQNSQFKSKLAMVQQHLGGGAPPPPVMPPTPPLSDFVMPEENADFEMSLDLDASEPLDLELSTPSPSFEPTPPPPPPPPVAPPPAAAAPFVAPVSAPPPAAAPPPAPRAAPPHSVAEEETEDLDFITEHLTEAEVFSKYGLSEKAVEHLRMVINRAPKHLPAYDRLLHVYLDEGDSDNARSIADTYLSLLRSRGDHEAASAVEVELASRGLVEAPAAPPAFSGGAVDSYSDLLGAEELSPAVESFIRPTVDDLEPAPEELTLDLSPAPPEELEFEVEEMETDFAAPEEPAAIVPSPIEPLPEETFEISSEPEAAPVDFEAALSSEPSVDTGLSLDEQPLAEAPMESQHEAAAFAKEPGAEELGEIDFYIEQDLYDEARSRLDGLMSRYPANMAIALRDAKLEKAIAAKEQKAEAAKPAQFSPADIENELMSAIPDDDDDIKIVSAPRAAAPPPVTDEGNLFADEDDFFDLAAELEEELEEETNVALAEEEQSLEEIFKEFKKGVEQQLDSEDYDTHYNLGIAYKEMGLIDEAIGEFQLASKDPKRTIECCSMLGLCFLEKGMPQLAVKWYSKGLEVPEITEDEQLGLMYDLANAYLEIGDPTNAHKMFVEIYGVRTSYRDVRERIKQIEEGGLATKS